jgi:hypothetical protein
MEARSQLRHRPTLRKDFFYSQTYGALSQTELALSCADLVADAWSDGGFRRKYFQINGN